MTVQIAPATAADLSTVTQLLAAQLQEHAIPLAPERLVDAIRGALADDGRALVLLARQGQQTLGVAYLSFQWTLERGGAAMWLEELYVDPEHRGERIGQRLLEAALDVGRARSCNSVELEVEASHARAANLYARAGFHALNRVRWTLPLR